MATDEGREGDPHKDRVFCEEEVEVVEVVVVVLGKEITMPHFILNNTHRYDVPDCDPKPEGAIYNDQAGYWIDDSGDVLISNDIFRDSSTKKCDRETGEDQKGE